jgi:membrane-associated phospholipid phosphatase
VLLIVSVIAPGVIIFLVTLTLVPGRTAARGTSPALKWRRKMWEWNTGWMGLGLSLAGSFLVTEGLKDLTGKPRPDFLARCDPDLSMVSQFTVSGLGADIDTAPTLVDYRICRNQSKFVRNDGFASWPSGHSSFSWAGMFYLTLFLCAKFAISIPYLAPQTYSRVQNLTSFNALEKYRSSDSEREFDNNIPLRNQAAAPPVYLLVMASIPVITALFISVSRWSDYRHAGFDVISGSLVGIFFAWFAFRWYHLPIRTGAGWSWGARSRERAFYTGLGVPTYVGSEGWHSAKSHAAQDPDMEQGTGVLGSGNPDGSARPITTDSEQNDNSASAGSKENHTPL